MDVESFYQEFGRRVRAVREAAGLTQAELASRIALSRASVANIERGNQRVALHQAVALAGALGVEPTALLPKREGFAARLGRAVRDAGLPPEIAAWGIRAAEQLEGEEGANDDAQPGAGSGTSPAGAGSGAAPRARGGADTDLGRQDRV